MLWKAGRVLSQVGYALAPKIPRLRTIRTPMVCCAAAGLLGACASKAPTTFDTSQTVGVAIVGSGPTVSFPTPSVAAARVAATAALTPVVGLLGLLAYHPEALSHAAKHVDEEAERATCVTSIYEGHPELDREIAGIVDRDFLKKMIADESLAYLSARTTLKVVAVQNAGGGIGDLTHEALLRQAKTAGVDVLFELSHLEVDFDVDYDAKNCAIRPSVRLNFRVILVSRDHDLETGYAFAKVSPPEEPGSKTVSRWLEDRGSLAKLIEMGYRDAMPRIWYVGLPSRGMFSDVNSEPPSSPNAD
jgi:hypothetical protein